jgi:hypothetical protein
MLPKTLDQAFTDFKNKRAILATEYARYAKLEFAVNGDENNAGVSRHSGAYQLFLVQEMFFKAAHKDFVSAEHNLHMFFQHVGIEDANGIIDTTKM